MAGTIACLFARYLGVIWIEGRPSRIPLFLGRHRGDRRTTASWPWAIAPHAWAAQLHNKRH
eukprot:5929921-Pyramimonas_sp.AAC.1